MSKVVRGVGRAIGKVVKGVANVVKKVASSKFGKILVGAALVYFGGAALMGGLGAGAGTGVSGFLSGAGQGIANAWTSLTQAAGSALGGQFTQAGSQLSAGIQGTTTALQAGGGLAQGAAAASQAAATTPGMSVAPLTPTQTALQSSLGTSTGINTLPAGVTTGAPAAANPGIIGRAWESLGPYGKAAAVSGGTQLVGGLIQGYGMQKAQDRQEQLTAEQKATYNRNIAGFKY